MAHLVRGKKKASGLKEWILWQLRRLSYRWPARGQAFREAGRTQKEFMRRPGINPKLVSARVRNFFECAECEKIFPRREVSADHKIPVVDPRVGWVSWDVFIPRLFCDKENFNILCNSCHDTKTKHETDVRTRYRRERKKIR